MCFLSVQFFPNKPYGIVWAQHHIKLSIFVNKSAHVIACIFTDIWAQKNTIAIIFVYCCALICRRGNQVNASIFSSDEACTVTSGSINPHSTVLETGGKNSLNCI